VVQLVRERDGFGIRMEKDEKLGVVLISQVFPNSPAANTGQILTGETWGNNQFHYYFSDSSSPPKRRRHFVGRRSLCTVLES